jgi:2'-hydroxyisoflavone reductase
VFNADGPAGPITMAEALNACAGAAGTAPQVEWVDEAFLLDHKVEPWMGLPLWIPEDDPEGLAVFDNARAVAAGLTFRPTAETAADTLAWELARTPGPLGDLWAGIPREQERELLAAWRSGTDEGGS